MICRTTAFNLPSGCPEIRVSLNFPTLDYCSLDTPIIGFSGINVPILRVPQQFQSPDIPGIGIPNCIDIEPIVNINIKSLYDGPVSRFVEHAIDNNLDNTPNTFSVKMKVLSGGSYAEGDCADGEYRLNLNFDIPCIFDSWPTGVPVKNRADIVIGTLRFTHLSGCRITGEMNMNFACSGTVVVEHCPLDNIQGDVEVIRGTRIGNINIGEVSCGFSYHANIPATAHPFLFEFDIYGTRSDRLSAVNGNFCIKQGTMQYMGKDYWLLYASGGFEVPLLLTANLVGFTGITVLDNYTKRCEQCFYKVHDYRILSVPIDTPGFTGPAGHRGQQGDTATIFFGRTGDVGQPGFNGDPGDRGDPFTCYGTRGPKGDPVSCYPHYTYPGCQRPVGSVVVQRIGMVHMVFGTYARLVIETNRSHILYTSVSNKLKLTSYVSHISREITIPTTMYIP